MTAPMLPTGPDESDPLTWIKRIQRAQQVQVGHPDYVQAQEDIPEMLAHLRTMIPGQRQQDAANATQAQTEARNVGPVGTAAEQALSTIVSGFKGLAEMTPFGAPYALGQRVAGMPERDDTKDLLNSIAGGPSVETSEQQNPFAKDVGTGIGIAAPIVAGGLGAVGRGIARRGAMKSAQLEGRQLANEILKQRLAKLTPSLASESSSEAGQVGRVMTDAERAAANEARMAGRASGDPLDEATYARRGGFTPSEASAATGEAAQTGSSATPPQPMDMLPSGQPKGLLGSGDPTAAIFALLGAQLAKDKQGNRVQ